MRYPFFIFIIGSAAAGKTTLAQKICESFPIFRFSTDMFALKEIFLINDFIVNCIREKKSDDEIQSSLVYIADNCLYWKDMVEKKMEDLRMGNLIIEEMETVKTEDGGHRIRKTHIWDDVLYRSCIMFNKGECYVFEFARGADLGYLKDYQITPSQVYHRCFSVIRNSNIRVTACNSLIIHIETEWSEREKRNRLRRLRGDHFVSQVTMEEVYRDEIFSFESMSTTGVPGGFLSEEFPIPVISINNTFNTPDLNFAFVLDYLRILIKSDI